RLRDDPAFHVGQGRLYRAACRQSMPAAAENLGDPVHVRALARAQADADFAARYLPEQDADLHAFDRPDVVDDAFRLLVARAQILEVAGGDVRPGDAPVRRRPERIEGAAQQLHAGIGAVLEDEFGDGGGLRAEPLQARGQLEGARGDVQKSEG